jgi:hypothetical protein
MARRFSVWLLDVGCQLEKHTLLDTPGMLGSDLTRETGEPKRVTEEVECHA